jgi:hypothetical protein
MAAPLSGGPSAVRGAALAAVAALCALVGWSYAAPSASAATAVNTVSTGDHRDDPARDRVVANLTKSLGPQAVFDVGDFASSNTDFNSSYRVYWTSLTPIVHPVPGDHELNYTAWKTYFSPAQIGMQSNHYVHKADLGDGWLYVGFGAGPVASQVSGVVALLSPSWPPTRGR